MLIERISWMSDEDDRTKALDLLDWPLDPDEDLEAQDVAVRSAIAALGIEFDEEAMTAAWLARQEAIASSTNPDPSAIMGPPHDTPAG